MIWLVYKKDERVWNDCGIGIFHGFVWDSFYVAHRSTLVILILLKWRKKKYYRNRGYKVLKILNIISRFQIKGFNYWTVIYISGAQNPKYTKCRTVRTDSTPFPNPRLECRFGDFGNLELLSLEILAYT